MHVCQQVDHRRTKIVQSQNVSSSDTEGDALMRDVNTLLSIFFSGSAMSHCETVLEGGAPSATISSPHITEWVSGP